MIHHVAGYIVMTPHLVGTIGRTSDARSLRRNHYAPRCASGVQPSAGDDLRVSLRRRGESSGLDGFGAWHEVLRGGPESNVAARSPEIACGTSSKVVIAQVLAPSVSGRGGNPRRNQPNSAMPRAQHRGVSVRSPLSARSFRRQHYRWRRLGGKLARWCNGGWRDRRSRFGDQYRAIQIDYIFEGRLFHQHRARIAAFAYPVTLAVSEDVEYALDTRRTRRRWGRCAPGRRCRWRDPQSDGCQRLLHVARRVGRLEQRDRAELADHCIHSGGIDRFARGKRDRHTVVAQRPASTCTIQARHPLGIPHLQGLELCSVHPQVGGVDPAAGAGVDRPRVTPATANTRLSLRTRTAVRRPPAGCPSHTVCSPLSVVSTSLRS
jgi:hypothetical protein